MNQTLRSFGASLNDIISRHLSLTLALDVAPSLDVELGDPDATGQPLLIVIDGLDEYDVGDTTVALAAARLVEHVQRTIEDWQRHGRDVRILLCGRPEAAASLTAHFRDKFHHLQVTGFVHRLGQLEAPANSSSKVVLAVDQREEWWKRWQSHIGQKNFGLPVSIANSKDEGVKEITSQPLLNYMIAVLGLHEGDKMSSLSGLYSDLFRQYYNRQSQGKFGAFREICPNLERFRRIMSEIGLAAWHAGDRSVGTEDLERRFDRPPLKKWLASAGETNRGLSAILSAFYTRPEESALPDKGLAQRYVFTHKSFREYLTAVAVSRFLLDLCKKLDPDGEDGWSDLEAMREWIGLFGPTPIDERQWHFIEDELSQSLNLDQRARVLK
ncbi:MAG: NACHT domain-containing protein, partial [Flammeovirgaceae bacterium]